MHTKSPIRVEQTSWQASEHEIKQIRTEVFVKEQNVPMDLDFDGLDPDCIQWLAYDDENRPVGTGWPLWPHGGAQA